MVSQVYLSKVLRIIYTWVVNKVVAEKVKNIFNELTSKTTLNSFNIIITKFHTFLPNAGKP